MITPQEALQRTIEHREIFHDEMLHLMRLIMQGELSPVMTAAIMTGLRVKKETIGEITAAAQVMNSTASRSMRGGAFSPTTAFSIPNLKKPTRRCLARRSPGFPRC